MNELAVMDNGRQFLSASDDTLLVLWDTASGQPIRRFTGHSQGVISISVTPDGRRALSSAVNDPLFLWDVASGKPIRRFPFLDTPSGLFYTQVAIHPDGRTALTENVGGTLVKWRLAEPAPAELIDWLATNRIMRELTCLERETYRIEPLCVDGRPAETTADMLAAVRQATATLVTDAEPAEAAPAAPLDLHAPARAAQVAALGENRGELARGDFDVWTYEGTAGELLSLHMVADRPLTDWALPVEQRYETGELDTLVHVIAPDGTSLDFTVDELLPDLTRLSDARILAVRLPVDGTYRIEARSALDDHAGPYTLILERLPAVWFPELYEEYTGQYLDGPWEFDTVVYIDDGRLYSSYAGQEEYRTEWIPLNETEFATAGPSITRMVRDENGAVLRYEVLTGFEHPIGGQWYEGVRLGDLPAGFVGP